MPYPTISKDRYDRLALRSKRSDVNGYDPRSIEFVKFFASLPGITTVWCCSGHTEQEQREKYIASQAKKGEELDPNWLPREEDGHVIFVTNDTGLGARSIEALMKYINAVDNDTWRMFRPTLEFTSLRWIWAIRGEAIAMVLKGHIPRYPCWKFKYNDDSQGRRHEHLPEFLNGMKTFVYADLGIGEPPI